MVEWHLSPEYIINNWTDELLELMIEKLAERRKQEMPPADSGAHKVSDSEFIRLLGNKIKVKK